MANILIVEDDAGIRRALEAELSDHSVAAYAEGFEALENIAWSYQESHFDLMIFDVVSPNIDGFTLTKIVRLIESLGLVKRTKIAVMSAYGSMIEPKDVRESGADFYWEKPEDLLTLKDFIREMFEK